MGNLGYYGATQLLGQVLYLIVEPEIGLSQALIDSVLAQCFGVYEREEFLYDYPFQDLLFSLDCEFDSCGEDVIEQFEYGTGVRITVTSLVVQVM